MYDDVTVRTHKGGADPEGIALNGMPKTNILVALAVITVWINVHLFLADFTVTRQVEPPFLAVRMKGFCGLLHRRPSASHPPRPSHSFHNAFTPFGFESLSVTISKKVRDKGSRLLFSLVRMKGFEPP